MNTVTAYAPTDMNSVIMSLIPVDTFIEAQQKMSGKKDYCIHKYPLLSKFDAVFQKTGDDIMQSYTDNCSGSEYGLYFAKRHAEDIMKTFIKHFNQVSDIHRIILYVKMKAQKFGMGRIEYAKRRGLPEYNERLVTVCLYFLRNYYGEIESMKILLTTN